MSALENVRALSEAQGRSVKDAEGKPIPDPLAYASAALELAATGHSLRRVVQRGKRDAL